MAEIVWNVCRISGLSLRRRDGLSSAKTMLRRVQKSEGNRMSMSRYRSFFRAKKSSLHQCRVVANAKKGRTGESTPSEAMTILSTAEVDDGATILGLLYVRPSRNKWVMEALAIY